MTRTISIESNLAMVISELAESRHSSFSKFISDCLESHISKMDLSDEKLIMAKMFFDRHLKSKKPSGITSVTYRES
jgi:hypothetical protein